MPLSLTDRLRTAKSDPEIEKLLKIGFDWQITGMIHNRRRPSSGTINKWNRVAAKRAKQIKNS